MRTNHRRALAIAILLALPGRAWAAEPAATPTPERTGSLENILARRPLVNGKLSLREAVATALHESPVLRGAVAEVEAATGRWNAARAERRPWLSANTFLSGGSLPNIVQSPVAVQPGALMALPRGGYADQNLMLMYPLFSSGRLSAMVRQSAALRGASEADWETQRQDVVLMTRSTYRQVLANRAMIEVWQARQRENEEQLRIDRARVDEGKSPPFYVQRDEAELAATNQQITNAERDIELALLQLKSVMGINLASQLELTDALDEQPSTEFFKALAPGISLTPSTGEVQLSALLSLAERLRPELRAAQARTQAAAAEAGVVRGTYRPQVNAFAMSDVLKMRGTNATSGATYGIVASVPIFNGGQGKANLQVARAEQQKREQERQRMALQIAQEVVAAMLNLRASEQNLTSARAALASAQEQYRVARIRYESGRSVLVEELDALAAQVRAEGGMVQARYQYNDARDQLLRAVGLLESPPIVSSK